MEEKQAQLILANGYLWIYLLEAKVHLFSLGDWLITYKVPKELSMNLNPKILDRGNSATLEYPGKLSRTIFLERSSLRDISPYSDSYIVEPIFKNSLHFRGWDNLPSINKPLFKLKDNEFVREGYPRVRVLKKTEEFLVSCTFPKGRAHISQYSSFDRWLESKPRVSTIDKHLNEIYQSSLRSLYKLRLLTADGIVKAAGYPSFPSLFGRDFSISALGETYIDPEEVRKEAAVHLMHIGRKADAPSGEKPGRAPHEFTFDVESLTNQYKHFPNWYSNDANPLLLTTIFRLARIQDDFSLINSYSKEIKALWEHMLSLDIDQDGLIEYVKHPEQFVIHQTWRDGGDQMQHADGKNVEQPIAPLHDQLCLVGALKEILLYQEFTGKSPVGLETEALQKKIKALQKIIEESYWMPELDAYALAIDGNYKQVKVVNSDVCLGYYYEVFKKSNARKQYKVLIDRDRLLDSNGLRTVSKEHPIYSPKSYQQGAVWPWQLALTIAGLQKYKLDVGPLVNCLKKISQGGPLAEVYIADKKLPIPLSSCVEQRWSSAVPWLALIEGLFGLTISYGEEPVGRPIPPREDIWQITIANLPIKNRRFKISLYEDGRVELQEENPKT